VTVAAGCSELPASDAPIHERTADAANAIRGEMSVTHVSA
jgi:hypothetical protein